MSTQTKRPSEYLKDYHCNLNVSNTFSKVKYPLNLVCFIINYHLLTHFFVMSISSHVESNTYSEVVKHYCWIKAIQYKISALETNQTWETVFLPMVKTVIGCKLVFKIKYKVDETVERYKARWVTNTQNYLESFSLVAKMTSIKLFLSLASIYNWKLK